MQVKGSACPSYTLINTSYIFFGGAMVQWFGHCVTQTWQAEFESRLRLTSVVNEISTEPGLPPFTTTH